MIRTLIVDDQNIVREGIKALLENSTEIELVGFAENGKSALEKVETIQPNVILLDINLPDMNGLTVAEQIGQKFPETKIIMLSSHEDESYVRRAVTSNAKGYLLKNVSSEELEWAIKLVHQGYSAFKSELLESLNQGKLDVSAVSNAEASNTDKQTFSAPDLSRIGIPESASQKDRDFKELELLLAKNQVRKKRTAMKNKHRNSAFHNVNIGRAKKTMRSFEFKLLVFLILLGLGSLVFIALS